MQHLYNNRFHFMTNKSYMASTRVSVPTTSLAVEPSLSPKEEDLLARSAKKKKPRLEFEGEGSL